MSSKSSVPQWQLTDTLGIGLDPMNWRLLTRRKLAGYEPPQYTFWTVDSYYPNLRLLLRGLQGYVLFTENKDAKDFPQHLSMAIDAIEVATDRLNDMIDMLGAGKFGADTYPPRYADYNLLPKENKDKTDGD